MASLKCDYHSIQKNLPKAETCLTPKITVAFRFFLYMINLTYSYIFISATRTCHFHYIRTLRYNHPFIPYCASIHSLSKRSATSICGEQRRHITPRLPRYFRTACRLYNICQPRPQNIDVIMICLSLNI